MANRKASTWMYVKAPVGWRYCKPVVGKNNRIKPGNTFDTRGVCPACLHQWTENAVSLVQSMVAALGLV